MSDTECPICGEDVIKETKHFNHFHDEAAGHSADSSFEFECPYCESALNVQVEVDLQFFIDEIPT